MAKKQGHRISLSTLGLLIFVGFISVTVYLTSNSILSILWGGFGIIICIAFFLRWAKNSFRQDIFEDLNKKSDSPSARLTCKNGHICNVWVNMDWGDRSIYHHAPSVNDIIYDVGGYEVRKNMKIVPDRCPKCGAGWQVPKKRSSRNR
jgi:hypothetical protein